MGWLKCNICREEMTVPGAIVLSPPDWEDSRSDSIYYEVVKMHVCVNCWPEVVYFDRTEIY